MSTELPKVTITDDAAGAFRAAFAEEGSEDIVHLTIDASYKNDLFVGPMEPGELVLTVNGITLAMDPASARRANGVTIDFVDGPSGAGFKLDNPNESPPTKGTRPADLLTWLEAKEQLQFVDARNADERAKAKVSSARWLDETYETELLAMAKTTKLVFMGHHSRGGLDAARRFYDQGFKNVWYVVGGIDAWSTWDPSIPRY